ncbi:hypothetical protein BDZ97DRAFT_1751033 [Flammula alnicola]|nr:hypothetical protein BDZ97DRAFT_1751033 [Flammula alnicola]
MSKRTSKPKTSPIKPSISDTSNSATTITLPTSSFVIAPIASLPDSEDPNPLQVTTTSLASLHVNENAVSLDATTTSAPATTENTDTDGFFDELPDPTVAAVEMADPVAPDEAPDHFGAVEDSNNYDDMLSVFSEHLTRHDQQQQQAAVPAYMHPDATPVGHHQTMSIRPNLRNPVAGFSRLFLARAGVYHILTARHAVIETSAPHLKTILRYAAEMNNTRKHPGRRIQAVLPAGYSEVADALNADPAQGGRLPIIMANGTVHYSQPNYPLRIDYPSPERIAAALALQDLMGEDADPRLMQNIAVHAAAESFGLRSRRGNAGLGLGRGAGPSRKRGRHF